jgi:CubicO group peptidase (beta-lactamase class C family)
MNDISSLPSPTLAVVGAEEARLSKSALSRLEASMRRDVEAGLAPGVSILIARRGKIGYRATIGSIRPGGPAMTDDAIFRVYSMTKPIVSVALMMLVEEGRLLLSDPVSKFLPAFRAPKVGVEKNGELVLAPAARLITVHDLMRHTSGLSYGFTGDSAVQQLYMKAPLRSQTIKSAEFVEAIAALPLADQPGAAWIYSHSTDVVGCLIEVVTGRPLGEHLAETIFKRLGMKDTGFFAPPEKHARLAEAFDKDPDTGESVRLIETRKPPTFESGGGGLLSTMDDYARFCAILANGGSLGDIRLLGRHTLAYMASNHLGGEVRIGNKDILAPGYGFGLGFGVRKELGVAPTPGTVGEFYWGGLAGTAFWISPAEELFALFMVQAPGRREYFREKLRFLVHAALL